MFKINKKYLSIVLVRNDYESEFENKNVKKNVYCPN